MSNQGLFSEPNNIIELFTFDLTSFFFEEDFEEVDCIEEKGVLMVEYQKQLPWIELKLFSQVVFRIFNDKNNIIGSSHINVKFPINPELLNPDSLAELTNTLFKISGWDDGSNGEWSFNDTLLFKKNKFERIWTLGEGKYIYTVKLTQNESGEIVLTILFFNHLLKLINQSISYSTNEFGV